MATTLDELSEMAKEFGLNFFADPTRQALVFGATGKYGRYMVCAHLELDGQFLQLRTLNYHDCPRKHPNQSVMLEVLGERNFRRRLVKYGWDPRDGEIAGYADLWIMDGDVTYEQWERMLNNFLSALDLDFRMFDAAIRDGIIPLEDDEDEDVPAPTTELGGDEPGQAGHESQALRDLIELLRRRSEAPPPLPDPGRPPRDVEPPTDA